MEVYERTTRRALAAVFDFLWIGNSETPTLVSSRLRPGVNYRFWPISEVAARFI